MRKDQTPSLFPSDQAEQPCGHIIRVAFESGADMEFDYLVPDDLWPVTIGQRIEAPFGRKNKLTKGFCVESDIDRAQSFAADSSRRKLKIISAVINKHPLLDAELMSLARWISSYYVSPLGQVLAAMVPAAVKKSAGIKTKKYVYLAEDTDQVTGKKQKQIIQILRENNAFDKNTGIELQKLKDEADCSAAPVKSLHEKLIIKIANKTILSALPAIPEGMSIISRSVTLNDDQQKALDHITGEIETGEFAVTLLHGVTDSGKTEVYIRAIKKILEKKQSAIVLLPEIALTTQTIQRFNSRFDNIAVMHSGLTAAQRNAQWQKIKSGLADVVIGARSAVFAPLPNLGLIVVDEEHEPSYKQDTVPRYHGRDVAIKRVQLANAHCLLGTATPSLETLFNCKTKKHFTRVSLPKRVMDLPAPQMKLVNLQNQPPTNGKLNLISHPLTQQLHVTLAKKEQAILLLNKRGYSNFIFCPSCRHTIHCRNCDVTLTFHKSKRSANKMVTAAGKHIDSGFAICHYCLAKTLVPEKCPLCSKRMTMIGIGSQRLEEELAEKFPTARIARIDSDAMAGKDYYRLLKDFGQGRIDILAGTQMLAKGLHFPNVTVVGIISADTCLYLPDFRANERTFQLISQVAGRTGRSQKKGTVFVQTFLANQPAIQFALKADYAAFVTAELTHRKACNLPPYWRLAAVIMRDTSFEKLDIAAKAMREKLDSIATQNNLTVKIRGPLPPPYQPNSAVPQNANNNPNPGSCHHDRVIHDPSPLGPHTPSCENRNKRRPRKFIVACNQNSDLV